MPITSDLVPHGKGILRGNPLIGIWPVPS